MMTFRVFGRIIDGLVAGFEHKNDLIALLFFKNKAIRF